MSNEQQQTPQPPATQGQRSGPPAAAVGNNGVIINSIESMWWIACRIVESGLAPKDCKGAADAFIRMQMGMEVGLHPMQAVQNIANINGRPSIWGPSIKALCLNSPVCERFTGRYVGPEPGAKLESFADEYGYEATAQRRGHDPEIVTFTVADAKRAGLWAKGGPWSNYPKEMLYYRAMGRAAKQAFPDVLGGLSPAEESRDIIDVTPSAELTPQHSSLDALAERAVAEEASKPKREAKPKPAATPEPSRQADDVPFDVDADGVVNGEDSGEPEHAANGAAPAGALF